MKKRLFTLITCTLFAVCGISNANLLSNGGFEINEDSDPSFPDGWGYWNSTLDGWDTTSGAWNNYREAEGIAHSGQDSMECSVTNAGQPSYVVVYSDFTAYPFVDYAMSAYGLDLSPGDDIQGAMMKLEWYNSSDAKITEVEVVVPLSTNGTWSLASITNDAPGGTAYGRAVVGFTGPWIGETGRCDIVWDDVSVIALNDNTPPLPDPGQWLVAPTGVNAFSITMTAVTATDSNAVEYLFENLDAGHDSGWQSSSTWLDSGTPIPASTNLVDSITNPGFSPVDSGWAGFDSAVTVVSPTGFVTSAGGVATVTPSDLAFAPAELNYYQEFNGSLAAGDYTFSIDAANITADGGPTVFVKEFDGGWGWIGWQSVSMAAGSNVIHFSAAAGNIYQVGTLTTGNTAGSYDLSNPSLTSLVVTPGSNIPLTELTSYDYRFQVRDSAGNTNGWSSTLTGTTTSSDTNAPTPNPMTFADAGDASPVSILLNASTASDDVGTVEYLFENVTLATDSGWQSSTQYLDAGLSPSSNYTYRVTARDNSLNETAPSADLMVATTAEPSSGSFSNSLKAIGGDIDDPVTLHNLAKLGLTTGSINPDSNLAFTTNGALFGAGLGYEARDLLKTVAAGYETVSFTAWATLTFSSQNDLSGYVGLGQGIQTAVPGNWGVPELNLAGVNGIFMEFKDLTAGGVPAIRVMKILDGTEDPSRIENTGDVVSKGETIRAKWVYDADTGDIEFSYMHDYTNGAAYTPDYVATNLTTMITDTNGTYSMFDGAPCRVYTGGGEGTTVSDFQIIAETTVPPTAVTDLTIMPLGSNQYQLNWTGVAGQTYNVLFKSSMSAGSWTTNTTGIVGAGGPQSTTESVSDAAGFFNVEAEN